tara:strand:+ start:4095 stop:4247 length:153 start_codon:yes stop_codon:yes gene_type:complete
MGLDLQAIKLIHNLDKVIKVCFIEFLNKLQRFVAHQFTYYKTTAKNKLIT